MVATRAVPQRNGTRLDLTQFISDSAYATDLNWVPGFFPQHITVYDGRDHVLFARVELLDDHATYQAGSRVLTVWDD